MPEAAPRVAERAWRRWVRGGCDGTDPQPDTAGAGPVRQPDHEHRLPHPRPQPFSKRVPAGPQGQCFLVVQLSCKYRHNIKYR